MHKSPGQSFKVYTASCRVCLYLNKSLKIILLDTIIFCRFVVAADHSRVVIWDSLSGKYDHDHDDADHDHDYDNGDHNHDADNDNCDDDG